MGAVSSPCVGRSDPRRRLDRHWAGLEGGGLYRVAEKKPDQCRGRENYLIFPCQIPASAASALCLCDRSICVPSLDSPWKRAEHPAIIPSAQSRELVRFGGARLEGGRGIAEKTLPQNCRVRCADHKG